MVYCFQPVSKVTKNKKSLNSFYKVKQERGDNGRFVGNGFLIVVEILSVENAVSNSYHPRTELHVMFKLRQSGGHIWHSFG